MDTYSIYLNTLYTDIICHIQVLINNIIYVFYYFRFYLECLLPEIVDPLYGKRLLISDIREPEHILNAQKKKKKINKVK